MRPSVRWHTEPQQNHLLAALSPEVQSRLFPYLELVPLPLRGLLYEARHPMRHVYFPTDPIVSMQYLMENGTSTAISVVGNEGLLSALGPMAENASPAELIAEKIFSAATEGTDRLRYEVGAVGPLAEAGTRRSESGASLNAVGIPFLAALTSGEPYVLSIASLAETRSKNTRSCCATGG